VTAIRALASIAVANILIAGTMAGATHGADLAAASAAPPVELPTLVDGPITPGRYVIEPPAVGWAECADWAEPCPSEPPQARTLRFEITIPSGWEAMADTTVIVRDEGSPEGPTGSGLVVGWTTPTAGLHGDPCQQVPHLAPDIRVGPTVDDLVEAVLAHPTLQVTEPVEVEVGGFPGRSFELSAPSDVSMCRDWRPFEPGIFAQGPENHWTIWAVDVSGLRMIILAEDFPATPLADRQAIRDMVASVSFLP
jgi:hypothetical protein